MEAKSLFETLPIDEQANHTLQIAHRVYAQSNGQVSGVSELQELKFYLVSLKWHQLLGLDDVIRKVKVNRNGNMNVNVNGNGNVNVNGNGNGNGNIPQIENEHTSNQLNEIQESLAQLHSTLLEQIQNNVHPVVNDTVKIKFPSEEEIKVLSKVLKEFGYANFRSKEQLLGCYHCTYPSNDMILIQPTGSGKTLSFLISSKINKMKVTVVIIPFIALLQDLFQRVSKVFNVQIYNSEEEIRVSTNILLVQVEYVTPQFQNDIASLYKCNRLNVVVIDEIHCFLQDADFRPHLQRISKIRNQEFPLILLSATLPPTMEQLLKEELNIPKCITIRQSSDRLNISFQVVKVSPMVMKNQLFNVISLEKGKILIVTRTINEAIQLHEGFAKSTIYHSKLSRDEREKNFNSFKGDSDLMFCTNGFGIGIDLPNIRLVIHFGPSYSLMNYYQEVGRGGRDGQPAKSIMFVQENYVEEKEDLKKFMQLTTCRRVYLLNQIDGDINTIPCFASGAEKCDNCMKSSTFSIYSTTSTTSTTSTVSNSSITSITSTGPSNSKPLTSNIKRSGPIEESAKIVKKVKMDRQITSTKGLEMLNYFRDHCIHCYFLKRETHPRSHQCPTYKPKCLRCEGSHVVRDCPITKPRVSSICFVCYLPEQPFHKNGGYGKSTCENQFWVNGFMNMYQKKIIRTELAPQQFYTQSFQEKHDEYVEGFKLLTNMFQ